MTDIEQKALALVNEVYSEQGYTKISALRRNYSVVAEALCRAFERIEELEATDRDCIDCDYAKPLMELQAEFEAFRREVSDAVEEAHRMRNTSNLTRFIIAKPDPLVEAMSEAMCGVPGEDYTQPAKDLRAALAARGLEIREVR